MYAFASCYESNQPGCSAEIGDTSSEGVGEGGIGRDAIIIVTVLFFRLFSMRGKELDCVKRI